MYSPHHLQPHLAAWQAALMGAAGLQGQPQFGPLGMFAPFTQPLQMQGAAWRAAPPARPATQERQGVPPQWGNGPGVAPAGPKASDHSHNKEVRVEGRVELAQRWLLFMRHCATCKCTPENSCEQGSRCRTGRALWTHMVNCNVTGHCKYPKCDTVKAILKHHKTCSSHTCPVCVPVKRYVYRTQRGGQPPPAGQALSVTQDRSSSQAHTSNMTSNTHMTNGLGSSHDSGMQHNPQHQQQWATAGPLHPQGMGQMHGGAGSTPSIPSAPSGASMHDSTGSLGQTSGMVSSGMMVGQPMTSAGAMGSPGAAGGLMSSAGSVQNHSPPRTTVAAVAAAAAAAVAAAAGVPQSQAGA